MRADRYTEIDAEILVLIAELEPVEFISIWARLKSSTTIQSAAGKRDPRRLVHARLAAMRRAGQLELRYGPAGGYVLRQK